MSGYLPDDCTFDDIDHYSDRDGDSWICGDPDCQARCADSEESAPCAIEGCSVIGCPSCETECQCCDKNCCSLHREKYKDTDGGVGWWCVECLAERRKQDADEQQRSAA